MSKTRFFVVVIPAGISFVRSLALWQDDEQTRAIVVWIEPMGAQLGQWMDEQVDRVRFWWRKRKSK